jgi:two-component system, NtrC family, response regulator HydG
MTPHALIFHSDQKTAEAGREILCSSGYECAIATEAQEALALVDSQRPQLCFLAPNAAWSEPSLLQRFDGEQPVIAISTFDTLEAAVHALKTSSVVTAAEQLVEHVRQIVQSFGLGRAPMQQPPAPILPGLIGTSPALKAVIGLMQKVSHSDANVLLCGESGTGKELAAKAIHAMSSRAGGAFVPVDCASLPENLLESELFGYEKGAFTGALRTKLGLIELAREGTLFLDEVGEIPMSLQAKLLRALQEREHRRVGGTDNVKFDVRVLSATSRDLETEIKAGKFRQDLFFRLNVIPIRLPSLREREGDVRLLANYFLTKHSEKDTGLRKNFSADVLQLLEAYWWPGNVRELENVVRRMGVLAEGSIITMRDVPAELTSNRMPASVLQTGVSPDLTELSFMIAKRQYVNQFEAVYLSRALDRSAGNVSRAADAAELDRKTFYRLLRKHHLFPQVFRPQNTPG